MKIEDIAAPPPRLAPQMRYASLHRSIESGLATDRTWVELVEACLELGRHGEAEQGFWQIKDASARRRILTPLQKHGLLLDVSLGATADLEKPGRPAAEHRAEEAFGERVADAARFLFVDHMPMTTVVATITFPLVIGLGGLLQNTIQGGPWLLLLAAIPALSVVGLVAALCRRILVDASRGLDDPPEVPGITELCRDATRLGIDFAAVSAALVGPSVAALLLGLVPENATTAAVASVVTGAVLLPIAFGLRQTRDDWSCLRPDILLRAAFGGGWRHLGTVLLVAILAAPAGLAFWATLGAPLYLSLAVTGPLAVAPAFLAARLLGQLLHDRRGSLPGFAVPIARTPTQRRRPAPKQRRKTARPSPKSEGQSRHPEAEPTRPASAGPNGGLLRVDPVPPEHAGQRRRRPQPAVTEPAATFDAPETRPVSTSRDVVGEAPLDLTTLPGFSILKGDARVAAGAASTRRR